MPNKKEYLLKDIANIFKGYSTVKVQEFLDKMIKFYNATEKDADYIRDGEKVKVLGWKDIRQYSMDYSIDDESNTINIGRLYNKNIRYIEKGDIVLPIIYSKDNFKPIYIDKQPSEKCIYNDSVLVIRIDDKHISSEYIYWLLCSNYFTKYIEEISTTQTTIKRITKSGIENMSIPILDDETINKIRYWYKQVKSAEYGLKHSIDEFNNEIDKSINN